MSDNGVEIVYRHIGKAGVVGFDVLDVDHHGELELRLHIDAHEGSCFLSKTSWLAIGERAGWLP